MKKIKIELSDHAILIIAKVLWKEALRVPKVEDVYDEFIEAIKSKE